MTLTNGNAEPTLVQRQLGRQLRQLRVRAGKTHADAEIVGMGHRSTLWRIEAGRSRPRPATVRALCWLYGADSPTTETLYAMACQNAPGWWEEYQSDLPSWFTLYVRLEAEARTLYTFQPNVVHGLLQTPDYARAVLAVDDPRPTAEDVERQVAIRRERRHTAFDRPDPLQLDLVLRVETLWPDEPATRWQGRTRTPRAPASRPANRVLTTRRRPPRS